MLPMRRLGLWSFCINRYGSLIRGSRSKIRALARPTSKVTNAERDHHIEDFSFVLRRRRIAFQNSFHFQPRAAHSLGLRGFKS